MTVYVYANLNVNLAFISHPICNININVKRLIIKKLRLHSERKGLLL